MGRVGFSIGFGGGSSTEEHHKELSKLPKVSPTSTSSLMEGGIDIPFLDAEEESTEMIAYRTQEPTVISAIEPTEASGDRLSPTNPDASSSSPVEAGSSESDIGAMRKRLSELEAEIEHLRSLELDRTDSSDQRIAELEQLLKEKRESEAALLAMLEEFQIRLDQQRLMIDQLMQRVDLPQAQSQP